MRLTNICGLTLLLALLVLLIHVLVLRDRINRYILWLSLILPLNILNLSSWRSFDIGLEKVQEVIVGVLILDLLTLKNSFNILFDIVDYLVDKAPVFLSLDRIWLLFNHPLFIWTCRETRHIFFLFFFSSVEEGLDVSLVDLVLNDSVAIH